MHWHLICFMFSYEVIFGDTFVLIFPVICLQNSQVPLALIFDELSDIGRVVQFFLLFLFFFTISFFTHYHWTFLDAKFHSDVFVEESDRLYNFLFVFGRYFKAIHLHEVVLLFSRLWIYQCVFISLIHSPAWLSRERQFPWKIPLLYTIVQPI